MNISEIQAKSILRKYKRIDSWFISRYGMNLYRGCTHNCAYCDGRAEGYYVEGVFGTDVAVKINAPDILRKELDPSRKRIPFRPCFMILGGGVGDVYQPVEMKYESGRKVLLLLLERGWPVHILTKSILVLRDIDLVGEINSRKHAILSMSFSSVDPRISAIVEPGVPSPQERLHVLSQFKDRGITTGMFLLPVIPCLTDTSELIEQAVSSAKNHGLDFVIFGGMTLKDGRQKEHYLDIIERIRPSLSEKTASLYPPSPFGGARGEYYDLINKRFAAAIRTHTMPARIPFHIFDDCVDENDKICILLDHIDYYLKLSGMKSSYSYASYNLSRIKKPFREIRGEINKVKGVKGEIEKTILEILDNGKSSLYDSLIPQKTSL